MVRYLSGSGVTEVFVKAANLINPIFGKYDDVDTAIITLTFENGAIAVIDNSRQAASVYEQRIEVFGDKGVVSAKSKAETNVQISTKDAVVLDPSKHFFFDRCKNAYIEEMNDSARAVLENRALASVLGKMVIKWKY